ncbi:MAG: hypothetical protein V4594_24965 [Bacteroidota bacterium]
MDIETALDCKKSSGRMFIHWGSSALIKADELRKIYISALKAADNGSIESLLVFAKS